MRMGCNFRCPRKDVTNGEKLRHSCVGESLLFRILLALYNLSCDSSELKDILG